VHAFADVHDTPTRLASWSVGLGVVSIVHAVPSQASANVAAVVMLPGGPNDHPTAVHAVFEVHDTADKAVLGGSPVGLGVFWTAHAVPSQASAKVTKFPVWGFQEDPTAVHAFADVHDTPNSWLFCLRVGLGVGWIAHAVPSQTSAKVSAVR
jgi:hypothetical protein